MALLGAVSAASSEAAGQYTISGLASGSYTVEFSTGFEGGGNLITQYFNGQATRAAANQVGVAAPNLTSGINATMQAGGAIAGSVSGGGAPLAEVEVCAESTLPEGPESCGSSDGNGQYSLPDLSTGTYNVSFQPATGSNFLPTTNAGVSVSAPNTTGGVNAALAGGGQISGTVTNGAGAQVCAFPISGELISGCAMTNGSGQYTISGLDSGSYEVEFFAPEAGNFLPQFYNGKSAGFEADPVSVLAGFTTSNINATLQTGGEISGVVTGNGGTGVKGVGVCAFESTIRCATTGGTGEYVIPGLTSGEYTVSFEPGEEAGNYARQYYNERSSSFEANLVAVTAGATTPNIDAALTPGGQISGVVTAAAGGAALANVFVCAFGPGVRCTSTDQAGGYTVTGLSTGQYTVSFFPGFEAGNYLSTSASGVQVTVSSTTSLNAALQPGGQIGGTVALAAGAASGTVEICAFGTAGFGCAQATPQPLVAPITPPPPAPAPNSAFVQAKRPIFNRKTGNLEFFFQTVNPGTFAWTLAFKNSDVGFADAFGASIAGAAGGETAEIAKRGKKCKRGYARHHGRCKRLTVPFGKGSKGVLAGTVEIDVHASAKALRALRAGRTLHVSGPFKFQSAAGGAPVTHSFSVVLHLRKPHTKHKKH
jgi:hypothetical protein